MSVSPCCNKLSKKKFVNSYETMETEQEDNELTLEQITANTGKISPQRKSKQHYWHTNLVVGRQDYNEARTKTSGQNKNFLFRMGRRIREIPKWGKVFLVTSFIFMVAIIVGSIASFISNSFRTKPSYVIYYLDSMAIVTAILMFYFAFEAVSIHIHIVCISLFIPTWLL